MTEELLLKLEEKMVAVCSELEEARKEIARLSSENANATAKAANYTKKVQELLSLVEAIDTAENQPQQLKPVLVQA